MSYPLVNYRRFVRFLVIYYKNGHTPQEPLWCIHRNALQVCGLQGIFNNHFSRYSFETKKLFSSSEVTIGIIKDMKK